MTLTELVRYFRDRRLPIHTLVVNAAIGGVGTDISAMFEIKANGFEHATPVSAPHPVPAPPQVSPRKTMIVPTILPLLSKNTIAFW